MTTPVPRSTDAIWTVIVAVVVVEVVTPVVWVLSHGNDCSAELLVVLDTCREVLWNHYRVLLFS